MPYPEDLRYMAVTTDPPCLLVKAAELQGADMAAYLADWEETRKPNDYVKGLSETETDHLKGGMMFSEGHGRYNLLINQGDGRFEDQSVSSGIQVVNSATGLAVGKGGNNEDNLWPAKKRP